MYIKILDTGVVVPTTQDDPEGIVYNGTLPMFPIWDAQSGTVVNDPVQQRRYDKEHGKTYTDANGNTYLVPLTREAQFAVVSVAVAFSSGAITATNIEFENGTVVPVTSTDFPAFAKWFATERNKFFV